MLPSFCNDDRGLRPGISKLNLCRDITESLTDPSLEFSPTMDPQNHQARRRDDPRRHAGVLMLPSPINDDRGP